MSEYEQLHTLELQEISPQQIKALRLREHLSQAVMAAVLNVSTSALQKWESDDNKPNGSSLRLLNIIEKKAWKQSSRPFDLQFFYRVSYNTDTIALAT